MQAVSVIFSWMPLYVAIMQSAIVVKASQFMFVISAQSAVTSDPTTFHFQAASDFCAPSQYEPIANPEK